MWSSNLFRLQFSLSFALITILVLIMQSGPDTEALSTKTIMDSVKIHMPASLNGVALKIVDWTSYMRTFDKHYSSIPQMLVRQSLFMTRLYETFITTIKHRYNLASYYTTINKYSDATPEEIGMLIGGDDSQLDETDFTDDASVDIILALQASTASRSRHKRASEVPDIPGSKLSLYMDGSERERSRLEAWAGALRPIERAHGLLNTALGSLSTDKKRDGQADVGDDELEEQVIVHKDWRETNCIGRPRDQGYCESCYAFSSTAFAEWAYCQHRGGQFTRLSPQYIINCGKHFRPREFHGCARGMLKLVPDFFKEYGLELEDNIPYVEQAKDCHVDESIPRERRGSIRPIVEPTIRLKNNTERLDKAISLRPVIVSMFTPRDFIGYGGGYIDDCDPELGGHAVLIVGSMSKDGTQYLLAQNSLGSSWGLKGYFKFKRTPDYLHKCVKHFMVPTLKFSNP